MSIEDEDRERLTKAVSQLGEYFDTVQIFCTRHDHGGTIDCTDGSGNWHARRGQISQWMIQQDHYLLEPEEHEE